MPFASSSLVQLRAIKEATFGVTPVTGNPTNLRITGETLNFDVTKTSSAEINSQRTIASMVPTTAKSSGGVTMEMRYLGIEPMLASTMQSAFVEHGTKGVGTSVTTTTISATVITAGSAPTGTSDWTNLLPGQWFRVASAGSNNGKFLRVHPVTAPTSTTITLDPSTPAAATSGEAIQIQSARLTHGIAQTSWTIEKESPDIGVFLAYTGLTPDKFGLKIASGSLTTVSFDFMGKSALEGVVTSLPGSPIAADNNEIHSGVSGATNAVWMDGVPIVGTYVKSVDFSFSNSLRSQEAIGTLGAIGIGSGSIQCTLSLSIYFADKNMFTKFRTNSSTSFSFASTDAAGNGYIISIPVGNISTWKSSASGKDQDQMMDISVTALADAGNAVPALRKLMFVDRVGVAAP